MDRIVIFGNSGSGKSTLATRLSRARGLAHLDLDTLAWMAGTPPRRRPLGESARSIDDFVAAHAHWLIEGCYSDLVELALPRCTRLVLLDPGVDACIANARARPWEPHKYATKAEQDANLEMLVDWIRAYDTRDDVFSRAAHRRLFDAFEGNKTLLETREAIAAFDP